jgi:excisionase family DNA binding protein
MHELTPLDLAALLADPTRVAEVPADAILSVLTEVSVQEAKLGTIKVILAARLAATAGRHESSNEMTRDRLLSADDAATILRVPKAFVYELIRKGTLAATAVGKYRRIDQTDLWEFLRKNRLDARVDAVYSPRRDRQRTPAPSQAAQTYAAGARRESRRDIQHRRAVGAKRRADPGADGPANHDARRPEDDEPQIE